MEVLLPVNMLFSYKITKTISLHSKTEFEIFESEVKNTYGFKSQTIKAESLKTSLGINIEIIPEIYIGLDMGINLHQKYKYMKSNKEEINKKNNLFLATSIFWNP